MKAENKKNQRRIRARDRLGKQLEYDKRMEATMPHPTFVYIPHEGSVSRMEKELETLNSRIGGASWANRLETESTN